MPITADSVREIFKGLESGDGAPFFRHVADDVDWIVEGTHPLDVYKRQAAWRPKPADRRELSRDCPNTPEAEWPFLLS